MLVRRRLVAAFVTLTFLTAGCLGGDGPADDPPAEPIETSAAAPVDPANAASAPPPGAVRAVIDGANPLSETRWENGSFTITESWDVSGRPAHLQGQSHSGERRIDISDAVPVGIPVHIIMEVNADLIEGDLDIWVDARSEAIWVWNGDTPYGGYSRVDATVLRSTTDPLFAVVFYDEVDPSPTFDYVLSITVATDPTKLMAGVPFELELPAGGATLSVQTPDAHDSSGVLVFDPDDTLLGRFDLSSGAASVTLPADAPEGAYVVLVDGATGDATLDVRAADLTEVTMRALEQEIVAGDTQTSQDGIFSWSVDLPRPVLQFGAQFWMENGGAQGFDIAVTGPDGTLFENAFTGTWIEPGFGFFTYVGQDGLGAGTYTINAEFQDSAMLQGASARHYEVYYNR